MLRHAYVLRVKQKSVNNVIFWGNFVQVLEHRIRVSYAYSIFEDLYDVSPKYYVINGFLLDPEYVVMAQHTNEEVMSGFYQLTEKLFPQSQNQILIASQLSQFRSGHGIFGRPVAKATANSLPAYQWWLNFGASVPELQSLAIKVLCQTASYSEAKRNWSLFGFLQSKRRRSLKCETLDRIVYIHGDIQGSLTV